MYNFEPVSVFVVSKGFWLYSSSVKKNAWAHSPNICAYIVHTGNATDTHYKAVTKKGIFKNTEMKNKSSEIVFSSLTLMDHDTDVLWRLLF